MSGKLVSFEEIYWGLRDTIDKSVLLSQLLERIYLTYCRASDPLIKLIHSQMKPGDVFYDIGAHTGSYSIILAKRVNSCLVYSFEPNPQSFARLKRNVHLMRLDKEITAQNAALGEAVAELQFYISSDSARSSLHKFNASVRGNRIVNTVTVNCYSIDYLVEAGICKAPNILKIDTEGHEYEVLLGARETISNSHPQIFVESHRISDTNNNRDKIKALLAQSGYNFKEIGYPLWFYK